jgi:enamine deaminase RidA (YjgF/YER057c/UK114 family)
VSAEFFREIFVDPIHDSVPAGVQIGSLIFAPRISADATPDLPAEERTEAQLVDVFTKMDAFLKAAGATRKDVARVTVFMSDILERPILNGVWERWYPDADDRAPHKYVPAVHPSDINVAIQVICLLNQDRTVLEIPGVQHGDPMSMGARTGNLVTSSRLFGAQPELDDQITLILERASILLEQAGGNLADLSQATFFVGSPEIGDAVLARWERDFSKGKSVPSVHIIEANLGGGNGFPRVEIMGLVGS